MNEPVKRMCPVCSMRPVPDKKKFCSKECYVNTIKTNREARKKKNRPDEVSSKRIIFYRIIWVFLWVFPALWFLQSSYNHSSQLLFNAVVTSVVYSGLAWMLVFNMIRRLVFPKK